MSEQSNKEAILNKTLQVLVRQVGLTPEEIAELRLPHLHLAGKNPNITFTPTGRDSVKTINLDLEAHRAMVGWLVARPDAINDFLFPGDEGRGMDPGQIRQALEKAEQSKPSRQTIPPAPPEADEPPASPDIKVTNSRPVPPLSAPEIGAPPPGIKATFISKFGPPPPTAPEDDKPVNIPLSTSTSKPTPRPLSKSTPPPTPTPIPISTPRPAPVPEEEKPRPTLVPETSPIPYEIKKEETKLEAPVGEQNIKVDRPAEIKETKTDGPSTKPAAKADSSPELKKEAKPDTQPRKKQPGAGFSMPGKQTKLTAQEAGPQSSGFPRLVIPVTAIVLGLLCLVCGGGWFVWQNEAGAGLLAALGLASDGELAEILVEGTGEAPDTVNFNTPDSPIATPTLPPTMTPTALPPTDTPIPSPTATASPAPTDTPLPPPTDTPVPTDTPTPTEPPSLEEPEETPTPANTPIPAMKYGSPTLLEPADGFQFIRGNTIALKWEPVDLAPDEQYAVRLVYRYNGEITYQGAQLKEPEWTIPLSLFGQVDPPENHYEWFVVIERLNDDGSGTAISPESEKRSFTWK